jgi:hypothetical protein
VDSLKDSVLRFGDRSDQSMGIGAFGVGLNRAIFRLGDSVHIVTDTARQRAEIGLEKEKYLESSSWNVPAQELVSTGKASTTIEIKHLQAATSKNFGDERWVNALKREIARRYGRFLKKKLAIWVNHDPLQNEEVQLREGGPIPITEKFVREDDVTVRIVYGQHRLHKFPGEQGHSEEQNRRLTTQYGWTILCNDRAVVMSDKTHQTGWDVTKFHSDFYGFVGYVNFVSQRPHKLPWTTTKTDVDLNNPAYQAALKVPASGLSAGLTLFLQALYLFVFCSLRRLPSIAAFEAGAGCGARQWHRVGAPGGAGPYVTGPARPKRQPLVTGDLPWRAPDPGFGSGTGGDPPVAPPGAPSPLSRGTEKGKRAGPGARISKPGFAKLCGCLKSESGMGLPRRSSRNERSRVSASQGREQRASGSPR